MLFNVFMLYFAAAFEQVPLYYMALLFLSDIQNERLWSIIALHVCIYVLDLLIGYVIILHLTSVIFGFSIRLLHCQFHS